MFLNGRESEITMRLSELAAKIGAKILTNEPKAAEKDIARVYAGDNISGMLNAASETTLLVTNIANKAINRVAELLDVPGVCLVGGVDPSVDVVDWAQRHGTVLMVSPVGMFETCGRLYLCLNEQGKPDS